MSKLSPNFYRDEFECRCGCGKYNMDEGFIQTLQLARDIAGIPFHITSGTRCPEHNKKVGGKRNSAHTRGKAADISCKNSRDRFLLVRAAIKAGINRIGVGDDFLHFDTDEEKPDVCLWLY